MKKSPRTHSSQSKTPTRPVTTRSESTNPYPTTFVQTDTSSFKQVVQMLTGSSNPTHQPDPRSIPPIKAVPNKKQSSGFRLCERRNSMKHLKINPTHPGFSTRKPDNLSPSILDFPSLVLSPITPLIPDPFCRFGSSNQSPTPTPRDPEPRLLPLFPLTSPRVSDSTSWKSFFFFY